MFDPSKARKHRHQVSHLERAIMKAEAADLACAACASPLKVALGGWTFHGNDEWRHACKLPGGQRIPNNYPAVPRRLFETGLLKPCDGAELEKEVEALCLT